MPMSACTAFHSAPVDPRLRLGNMGSNTEQSAKYGISNYTIVSPPKNSHVAEFDISDKSLPMSTYPDFHSSTIGPRLGLRTGRTNAEHGAKLDISI
jgi:hypothetical protein